MVEVFRRLLNLGLRHFHKHMLNQAGKYGQQINMTSQQAQVTRTIELDYRDNG